MTREEQIQVCEAFELGEPISCEPLRGTRNRNYRLTTTRYTFIVRDRAYRDPEQVAFDHEIIELLSTSNLPVPEAWQTLGRKHVLERGSHMWEVFPWVDGEQLQDADPVHLLGLGKALADFHIAGSDLLFPNRMPKLGPRGETHPGELRRLIAMLRKSDPGETKRYEEWTDAGASALSDEGYNSLPHTIVHGDIQPGNIIMSGSKVAAFVDFDWCEWRPRVYDLAFSILLCCASHETPIDGGDIWSLSQPPFVNPELVRKFLTSYEQQGWALSAEERAALRAQVMLSWCHVRLAGAMKVEPSRRAEFLARPPHDLASLFPDGIT